MQTIYECAAELKSMSDGFVGHGFGWVMEPPFLTGIGGMVVYFLLSVLWLFSLPVDRS